MNTDRHISPAERHRIARHVTWVGFLVNLVLSLAKIAAGALGRSGAMIADGIHSFSDFVTDAVVLVFIRISSKARDDDHPYGHGKFETFATMLIGATLLAVGAGLIWSAAAKIIAVRQGEVLPRPRYLALAAAAVSILVKETLYRYTAAAGRRIGSGPLTANAWHHRSDALSSVGTLLGIAGAIFLGPRGRILDPLASFAVSLFILGVAWRLTASSVGDLLDKALPPQTEQEISECIASVAGVRSLHNLRTRRSGNDYLIEVHIRVDRTITVVASHDIASRVERAVRQRFGDNTLVTVHVEPDRP